MIYRIAIAALAFLVLTAANAERASMSVTPAWLAEHLADPELVLFHVGTPEGYAKHIPGARFVKTADIALSSDEGTLEMPPPEDLRQRLAALGIADKSRIVVYYGQNQVAPATRIIFTLEAAGLGARTSLLDGGMAAWEREGRATTADIPPTRHRRALGAQYAAARCRRAVRGQSRVATGMEDHRCPVTGVLQR